MTGHRIIEGDALQALAALEADSVDALVTDPPYGLGFMGKAWDAEVCGKWPAEALRVLKPGAHLVAFGGTRTYHRLACAIEDAGFEIRDSLMWLYGSGFPKSLNLDGDREGWGTALKPAHEPIVLARKPLAGTVAANVAAHGTGALNVDGCRVEATGRPSIENKIGQPDVDGALYGAGLSPGSRATGTTDAGRWPPNVLLTHAADCRGGLTEAEAEFALGSYFEAGRRVRECAEGCPVGEIDRQSGNSRSVYSETPQPVKTSKGHKGGAFGAASARRPEGHETSGEHIRGGFTDSGGASRFFPRFRYVAKASSGERNAGLEGMERRAAGLHDDDNYREPGERKADHTAAMPRENHHPTVKPIDLMRWLCRLVTPPGGLILDPFMGSGTTGIAALREGFRFLGIEREAEYVEIARRRIEEDAPLFNRAAR